MTAPTKRGLKLASTPAFRAILPPWHDRPDEKGIETNLSPGLNVGLPDTWHDRPDEKGIETKGRLL